MPLTSSCITPPLVVTLHQIFIIIHVPFVPSSHLWRVVTEFVVYLKRKVSLRGISVLSEGECKRGNITTYKFCRFEHETWGNSDQIVKRHSLFCFSVTHHLIVFYRLSHKLSVFGNVMDCGYFINLITEHNGLSTFIL